MSSYLVYVQSTGIAMMEATWTYVEHLSEMHETIEMHTLGVQNFSNTQKTMCSLR